MTQLLIVVAFAAAVLFFALGLADTARWAISWLKAWRLRHDRLRVLGD